MTDFIAHDNEPGLYRAALIQTKSGSGAAAACHLSATPGQHQRQQNLLAELSGDKRHAMGDAMVEHAQSENNALDYPARRLS